jgi:hypothetical protein
MGLEEKAPGPARRLRAGDRWAGPALPPAVSQGHWQVPAVFYLRDAVLYLRESVHYLEGAVLYLRKSVCYLERAVLYLRKSIGEPNGPLF